MKQKKDKKQSNKRINSILYLIIIFTVAVLVFTLVSYLSYSDFCVIKNKAENNIKLEKSDNEKVYFAKGKNEKYSLIDIKGEEVKDFIPGGYKIVGQHSYEILTDYLILQKDSNLFLYSVQDEKIDSLTEKYDYFKLAEDEDIRLKPSITEKDKFYIVIYRYKIEEMGMGIPEMLSTRSYYLNASNIEIKEANEIEFNNCYQYDSKNKRFFSWPCGEGIGVSIPLSILDLEGNEQEEIISLQNYGLDEDDVGAVSLQYNNGYFLASEKGNLSKVTVVDAKYSELKKDEYILSDEVKSEIDESYPYSSTIVLNKKTIVIGGSNFMLLLKFDENKQVIESKYIEDKEIYANFIFPYNGKIYYQAKNALRILNLDTWEIEKSFQSEDDEEITLIKLNK